MLKYRVTKVYPDAIEIWDGSKDRKGRPIGQMLIWINDGGFEIDDEVTLHVKKIINRPEKPDRYPGEPIGRSAL